MADIFRAQVDKTNPGTRHFAITPSNTEDMAVLPRAIYCQSAGTAQIVDSSGTVLPYTMNAGDLLVFRGVRINATSTTGTYYGWY